MLALYKPHLCVIQGGRGMLLQGNFNLKHSENQQNDMIFQPMVDYVDQKELEWKDLQLSDAVIRDLLERLEAGLVIYYLTGRVNLYTTRSQINPSYECGKWMKVKVAKWCWKK